MDYSDQKHADNGHITFSRDMGPQGTEGYLDVQIDGYMVKKEDYSIGWDVVIWDL